jgi:2'-5' RNA ligase
VSWLVSSTWLSLFGGRRTTTPTHPSSGPGAAIYQTTVIRIPPDVAAVLAAALKRLHEYGPQHYYYPVDTMHVTVLNLDGFLRGGQYAVDHLANLRAAVAAHPSFDLTVCGLNVSPTTVFAQVVPCDRTLHALRRDLSGIAQGGVPRSDSANVFGSGVRTLLAHASVARFSGQVSTEFLDELSRFRHVQFGRWTVHEVELVQTDKLLSRDGTQVIERMPLTASGA